MKSTNISERVLERVIQLERRRIAVWWRKFWIVISVFVLLSITTLGITGFGLWQQRTFDLFAIFAEDSEIIVDYWQDTFMVFFAELPVEYVFYAAVGAVGILVVVILTQKRRKILRRRSQEVAFYRKKQHNNMHQ